MTKVDPKTATLQALTDLGVTMTRTGNASYRLTLGLVTYDFSKTGYGSGHLRLDGHSVGVGDDGTRSTWDWNRLRDPLIKLMTTPPEVYAARLVDACDNDVTKAEQELLKANQKLADARILLAKLVEEEFRRKS